MPTKVCLVKAMVFPVVMYGCESWTIKKLSAKELMLLNRGIGEGNRELSEIPLDNKEIKPVNHKGNQSEYSLERLMLKLKLQYFGHLIRRADSLEKTLMLGTIEGGRRRGQQRRRWLDGITNSMDEFEQAPGDGEGQGSLECCSPWGHKESDTTERLN